MTTQSSNPIAALPSKAELRILAGVRKGSRTSLTLNQSVTLGYEAGNDLVVRDKSLRDVQLRLTPGQDVTLLEVISGSVKVIGKPVNATESVNVPIYVPIMVNGCAIALGGRSASRWQWSESLAQQALVESLNPSKPLPLSQESQHSSSDTSSNRKLGTPVLEKFKGLFGSNLALKLAGIAFLVFGTLGIIGALFMGSPEPSARALPISDVDALVKLEAALRQSSIRGAKIKRDPDGTASLTGFVDKDADVAALAQLVSTHASTVRMSVNSGERLERNLMDVMRAKGLDATVTAREKNNFSLLVKNAVNERQEDVLKTLESDVAGIGRVSLEMQRSKEVSPDRRLLTELEKQIVAVVSGDPAYVVTTDGGRHYTNAFLPGGHRIMRISGNEVDFMLSGKVVTLRF